MQRVKPQPKYNKAQVAAQTHEALRMRIQGMSLRAIGEVLGLDHNTVSARVSAGLRDEVQPSIEEYRRLELARMDELAEAMWRKAIVDDSEKHANTLIRISERRSKLLGLDAPTNVQVTTVQTTPFDERMKELVAELGINDPGAVVVPAVVDA